MVLHLHQSKIRVHVLRDLFRLYAEDADGESETPRHSVPQTPVNRPAPQYERRRPAAGTLRRPSGCSPTWDAGISACSTSSLHKRSATLGCCHGNALSTGRTQLQAAGHSMSRQVRAPRTIARELKRMAPKPRATGPVARQQARARRWRSRRGTAAARVAGLKARSPEQVAGRLALEAGRRVISYESISASSTRSWPARRTTPGATTCPGAKSKRGWRGRKGGSSATFIQLRRPLSQRPTPTDSTLRVPT